MALAVSASSGQNAVSSTVYNTASLPTTLNFGSGDNDAFLFDASTNRMTQYQFNVNGQSLTGALTWNANSTLQKLVITDAFNSSNAQTCIYAHDDLSRLASANCGSPWSQTFGYDPFGNITKSGSSSFQPTYNPATNRMSSLPGFTPTYDANGNVLNDSSHSYAWNSEGRPVTIDSVSLTYDALGRMVEQNRSGAYTQIVYGPGGQKLALFNGQTLQEAFVSLPGGAQAVYNASGILYYAHSDHLGSTRFGSTPSRTMYFDMAYAPFGEQYAQKGTTDPSFTGQRQDTVSGLYDFPAREYSTQGRWPSPDPAGLAGARLTNPQSLNRYAYVMNNPLMLTDPTGMDPRGGGADGCLDPELSNDSCFDDGGGGGGFDGGGGIVIELPWLCGGISDTLCGGISGGGFGFGFICDPGIDLSCGAIGGLSDIAKLLGFGSIVDPCATNPWSCVSDAQGSDKCFDSQGNPSASCAQGPPAPGECFPINSCSPVSLGMQWVNAQFMGYSGCAATASTQLVSAVERTQRMADQARREDPLGGPLGPDTIYPGGSSPPSSTGVADWMTIIFGLSAESTYNSQMQACADRYPLAALHP